MRRRVRMIAVGIVCLLAAAVTAQVLTQHNDSARTGENLGETVLNVLNVNVNQFGKLFTEAVDGQIYAQPLYVPNVVVSGLTRNVVVVATEHNSVFAIDADATAPSTPLWQMNLGPSVPSGDIANWCRNIWPEIGVTSTPVIDPVGGTVYVVAMSKELVGASYQYFHRLHALDLATGAEKFGGPVDIQATVPGSGDGGSTVAFTPIKQLNRPGLLLSNGVVFVAFASHCDIQPYHGWVFGYAAGTLQRVAVLNTTPNGAEGGIWQSGNGLMADAGGSVYAMTGNGTFDANGGGPDYGDTVLKLATGSLTVTDWFTPGNQKTLNQQDLDLGTGGPVGLPGTSNLVGVSKQGMLYVLNTGNLGHFTNQNRQIPQSFRAANGGLFGSPVYWNGLLYLAGAGDVVRAYKVVSGLLQTRAVSQSTFAAPFPGGILAVSANGNTAGTGILWVVTPDSDASTGGGVSGTLHALSAADLTKELWNSKMNAVRDALGNYVKFNPPTVAAGKVYMATLSGYLAVYGLLP